MADTIYDLSVKIKAPSDVLMYSSLTKDMLSSCEVF